MTRNMVVQVGRWRLLLCTRLLPKSWCMKWGILLAIWVMNMIIRAGRVLRIPTPPRKTDGNSSDGGLGFWRVHLYQPLKSFLMQMSEVFLKGQLIRPAVG